MIVSLIISENEIFFLFKRSRYLQCNFLTHNSLNIFIIKYRIKIALMQRVHFHMYMKNEILLSADICKILCAKCFLLLNA